MNIRLLTGATAAALVASGLFFSAAPAAAAPAGSNCASAETALRTALDSATIPPEVEAAVVAAIENYFAAEATAFLAEEKLYAAMDSLVGELHPEVVALEAETSARVEAADTAVTEAEVELAAQLEASGGAETQEVQDARAALAAAEAEQADATAAEADVRAALDLLENGYIEDILDAEASLESLLEREIGFEEAASLLQAADTAYGQLSEAERDLEAAFELLLPYELDPEELKRLMDEFIAACGNAGQPETAEETNAGLNVQTAVPGAGGTPNRVAAGALLASIFGLAGAGVQLRRSIRSGR
jgi:hypothetical protein